MLRYEKALVVQGMNHTGERAEEAASSMRDGFERRLSNTELVLVSECRAASEVLWGSKREPKRAFRAVRVAN